MDIEVATWIFAVGTVGGLVFLIEKGYQTAKSIAKWNFTRKLRSDLLQACEDNNVTIDKLEITENTIDGVLEQGDLQHGFHVAYEARGYNPRAMDAMVRAIATSAGFDIPERAE